MTVALRIAPGDPLLLWAATPRWRLDRCLCHSVRSARPGVVRCQFTASPGRGEQPLEPRVAAQQSHMGGHAKQRNGDVRWNRQEVCEPLHRGVRLADERLDVSEVYLPASTRCHQLGTARDTLSANRPHCRRRSQINGGSSFVHALDGSMIQIDAPLRSRSTGASLLTGSSPAIRAAVPSGAWPRCRHATPPAVRR